MGQDLHGIVGADAVESPGEIGTLAYYCDCTIVDAFSDRGRVISEIELRERDGDALATALLRLNYAQVDLDQKPPAGRLPPELRGSPGARGTGSVADRPVGGWPGPHRSAARPMSSPIALPAHDRGGLSYCS